MPLENLMHRVKESAHILATGRGKIKDRLAVAVSDKFLLANVPDEPELPDYFRVEIASIISGLTVRDWSGVDRLRATLHRMRESTAQQFAERIWRLHHELAEYSRSGFVPESDE
ncbi:hypothetical protein [Pseudomonas protegens]|uniref:hypothetical protein n=1 Tax=Pseudomonas protegens TaxID=380021 RepID=UPI0010724461|nr:hypothetical protein [Pseudomonas protegens]